MLKSPPDIAKFRQQRRCGLVIFGEGLEKENLNNLIYELELQAEVSLLGFVNNPYADMADSAVFVLSSVWQGFGNVILKALASSERN
ncbi:glycosyltransferase [Rivularia sp. PCC 7116]|uniref:glycosyltransferase n=1 Tax=Rivularia sp. PCC 7116 TaxID=373994 RepID=UPI00031E167F|nr:glycosyltransferase [Rivularia sp. PCC 7116]